MPRTEPIYAASPISRPPMADRTRCRSVRARADGLLRVATHKSPSIQPADGMRWWHHRAIHAVSSAVEPKVTMPTDVPSARLQPAPCTRCGPGAFSALAKGQPSSDISAEACGPLLAHPDRNTTAAIAAVAVITAII